MEPPTGRKCATKEGTAERAGRPDSPKEVKGIAVYTARGAICARGRRAKKLNVRSVLDSNDSIPLLLLLPLYRKS